MRVLLISQYFPPETGGPPNRLLSIANGLRDAGHEVHVIAEKPNHPEGIIREGYRGGIFDERTYDGISVTYTWVYTHPEKDFVKRLSFYLSFMVMAILGAWHTHEEYDVVLASSPPLFVGVSGWLAAQLKGAKFVFDVRDLWPDLAVAMNELDGPLKIWLAKRLEHFIYHRADAVTAVTNGFCETIQSVTGPETPVQRVMNGTEPEVFQRDEAGRRLRKESGFDDRFVVTYAGNIGICQGLDHILEAAERLEKDRKEVLFRFVGSGPVKDKLQQEAERRSLDNVEFHRRVSLDEAAAHMAAADALLVPLADHEIYRSFIPSKLFDSMAAGRPVLLSVDGEARSILEDAEAGRYYPAEHGQELANNIRWMLDHPEACTEMGENGRAYAQSHCTRETQAKRMTAFLEELAG
ncbi:glycosyltransferase involved in cell wall biosynthesis [Salinibacter ruber]|uniref:glycosyltransferase family 4 protein n=1 Tax=Salinibacter ruber TaxID=146919 RepID=UPI0021688CF4|nr:glycosyltransferase family 4 protein [Salinibacter ruber]MCS3935209.1 glycosyltransferase involved in cell wall biosynthesis [Salinibacter ruber]MCS4043244.1 glycosyltransferase involved in cell wall biosynthesis [Salinibacter ruber]